MAKEKIWSTSGSKGEVQTKEIPTPAPTPTQHK